jgi:hypothetical protein
LFKYCKDKLRNDNIHISFPRDTDPRHTYQWRYLTKFIEKVDKFQISDAFGQELAYNILADAFTKNRAKANGISILNFPSAIESGLNRLVRQESYKKQAVEGLTSIHTFLSNIPNCIEHLIRKPRIAGSPNIVLYHMQGKISTLYLSVSLTCAAAMRSLSPKDRRLLPPSSELFECRFRLLNDNCLCKEVQVILGEDWRFA